MLDQGFIFAGLLCLVSLLIILFILAGYVLSKFRRQLSTELDKINQVLSLTQTNNDSYRSQNSDQIQRIFQQLQTNISLIRDQLTESLHQGQVSAMQTLSESLHRNMQDIRQQIDFTLKNQTNHLNQKVNQLTQETGQRIQEIGRVVESQLACGFEKTNATFTDIIKRLALIDSAQQKISELSSNIMSLQTILADKRARGAFGEVQLSALIKNVIPPQHFALQYTLTNNKRADCILFLPEPTGHIVIDAKFPLETHNLLNQTDLPKSEKRLLEQQFRQDIRHHIKTIADKYIIPGETADGAMMFIPAESIFAEIHATYPDLVETAYKARVWLVSPTTMMAILNTARAVLKDSATRKQIHIIQKHLGHLAQDFQRFQARMNNLARHIKLAHEDVSDVNTSAQKITNRFNKIEQVELAEKEQN